MALLREMIGSFCLDPEPDEVEYSGSTPTTTTTTKWGPYPRRQLGPDHLTKPSADTE
jgi:hypothetical protein